MSIRDKLLLAWLLVVVALSFLFHHFWSCTVYALEKAVAFGFLPLVLSKIAAAIAGIFLCC